MTTLPLHECPPLTGIRVVDFGAYLCGPLVGRILADAGAHVTHVDREGGAPWGNKHVHKLLNRGKRCVQLDLASPAGLHKARELVNQADVVIDNFAPGTMAKFGLGKEEVTRSNPRLVYLSLPGFASTDEEFAHIKAYEAIILARSGVFSDMGLNRTLMGVNPSYSPLPLASTYSASIGAFSVVAALFDREKTGLGDCIEVPLAAGLCECLVYNTMDVQALPERYVTLRELEIARRRENNDPMDLSYDACKALLDPFYHTYVCKDGRPFYVVAPCHRMHQERVLRALGLWEEMQKQNIPTGDIYADSKDWGEGVRMILGTYPLTDPIWLARLKKRMTEAFLLRPAHEWDRIFGGMKIPGTATLTSQEWMQSEHALASGLVVQRIDEGSGATVTEAGPVVWTKRSRVPTTAAQREKAKTLGMAAGSEGSGWLHGLKVLDLCNVIAGPVIGGVMARFGADVVKVDPAKPTYDALVAVFMGIPPNRGKRSLLADVKGEEGRVILERLVQWADVVLTNQAEMQLRLLGVDEASLKAINPHVILTHFDAFGGPQWGPKSDCVGYDDLIQARTGIMARFGGGLGSPEEHAHLGTVDVISGWSGALATSMALFKRRRTGVADTARTSLASNGTFIQTPFMFHYEGKVYDEPSGPSVMGEGPLYRWYQAKDAAFFVAIAQDKHSPALAKLASSLPGFTNPGKTETESALERCVAVLSCADAIRAFREAGVTAVNQYSMAELREANISQATSFGHATAGAGTSSSATYQFRSTEHPIGGKVTIFSPCSIRSSNKMVGFKSHAPKYGEHTREVLAELGFSTEQVERFAAKGVVADQWSDHYIPQGNPWEGIKEETTAFLKKQSKL